MKKNLFNNLSLCMLISFFLTLSFFNKVEAKIELLDRVIAIVDTGVIMESELNGRVEDIIGRLRSEGTELPPKNLLEEQVLERLIIEEIQLQKQQGFLHQLLKVMRIKWFLMLYGKHKK